MKVMSPSHHHPFLHPGPLCFHPPHLIHPLPVAVLPFPFPCSISSARPFFPFQSNFPTLQSRFHPSHSPGPLSPCSTLIPAHHSLSFGSSLSSELCSGTSSSCHPPFWSSRLPQFRPGAGGTGVTWCPLCPFSPFPFQLLLGFWAALHFLFCSALPCSSHLISSMSFPSSSPAVLG